MKPMTPELKRIIDDVTRQLTDEGKLIEAGWQGMRHMSIKDGAPEIQLVEMRVAFFAGAQHLFGSMMGVMEPGAEPTQKDMDRLSMIQQELDQFIVEFERYIEMRKARREH